MTDTPSVIVMPETDAHTLCIEMTGFIREQDHREKILPWLTAHVEQDGWYNMVVYYNEDFQGWEEKAADLSLQSIMDYGRFARRLAYVNPTKKKIFMNKISAPLFGGEIRYFEAAQLKEALQWAKAAAAKDSAA